MGRRVLLPGLCAITLALAAITCYPVRRARTLTPGELAKGDTIDVPSKVHVRDGSVILFADGFRAQRDTVFGFGPRYHFGVARADSARWTMPLDSILGVEYFDETVPGARGAASIPLAFATAQAVALLGAAMFGSCPTVYTFDETRHRLEAECFSYSIGSMYELADLDRLEQRTPAAGRFTLRLLNEALETHYIDRFRMAYVDHPAGTEAFPTDKGEVLLVRNPRPAAIARSSQGQDVTSLLRYRDNLAYAIDTARISELFSRGERDWIELTLPVSPDSREITLALRGRNSLENTVLLYDVMMRDQGLSVIDWSQSLDNDLLYAYRLHSWYETLEGIDIEVENDGVFEHVVRIADTGPIAWKPVAATVPLPEHGDSVRVRLSFIPDNWRIDWVGFEEERFDEPELRVIDCSDARGNVPALTSVADAIADDDGEYLVTYPGEWLDLSFELPANFGRTRTLFVDSKGYYVEWIRPEWVRERPDVPGFDIGEPETITARLAERWIQRKIPFEREFYDYRVPTADPERPW